MKGFGDHSKACRVELQVERGRLEGLLFLSRQTGKAIREGVGDTEFNANVVAQRPRPTTSSSRLQA